MDLSKQLSEEKFGKMAESYQIHELEETCKMITENESLFNDLGLTCLNYVLNTNRITSIKKIEWINHFYQPYLTNESISQKIFLFLLSLRFEEQDLMDIELYQLMSNTFPKVAPSTTELWEQALMPFMEKMKQREEFSDIIDSYLYDPSIHPNINTHDDLAIISSLQLFNILCESELQPLNCDHKLEFGFSDIFNEFIVYIHNSDLRRKFTVDAFFVENQFDELMWNIPKQTYQLMPNIHFDTYDSFNTVLRECIYLLGTCHHLHTTTIAFALVQLFEFAKTHYNLQTLHHISEICQTSCFEHLRQLLRDSAFVLHPNTIHKRLFRTASSYVLLRHAIPSLFRIAFPVFIWDQYCHSRAIFINSLSEHDHQAENKMHALVERVIFTCCLSSL